MKNLVFALLCSTSLVAQFGFNSTDGTGIQSSTKTLQLVHIQLLWALIQQQVVVLQLQWVKEHSKWR